jgi:DHA1 family multidrug/chloramphenicol efflux transport protein-like MFS transporter
MGVPLIPISKKQAYCFAAFLVFYEFLTYIANDMIMPGMLHVVQSFHAPESAVATSLTAYVLGGASLQVFLGPLSDRFGRRPVMLIGSALFCLFTLYIAFAHSIDAFLWARFFQGMGLCFIGVIGYTVLQEIFAEMDAVRLIAILANVSLLAPLLGPLFGASTILYFDWRTIFIVIGILAVTAFWGLWRYMPESVGVLKKDGERIPRVSLAPRVILGNYKKLVSDATFMSAAIATGLLVTPCLAWIGISPIIIIADAKLSVMDYALWQIPLFAACIIGNWTLHRLTHYYSLKGIILSGSVITLSGLLLSYLLPLGFGPYFLWLMPGVVLYGLGIGITGGPLNRHALFSTSVSKGTANALLSVIYMGIQGIGVEIGKYVYASHSNVRFGLYFVICGAVYAAALALTLYLSKKKDCLVLP